MSAEEMSACLRVLQPQSSSTLQHVLKVQGKKKTNFKNQSSLAVIKKLVFSQTTC